MNAGQDDRRLRVGMVGGGRGAFIGPIHRIAAEFDGDSMVIAGALSSDPPTARQSAAQWRLQRSYDSFEEMAHEERALSDGIDFVIVATPNDLHVPVATAFARAGIHVVCDKPLAASIEEGRRLSACLDDHDVLFALTHTYSGYPAIRGARALIRDGILGTVRKVHVEYLQDWLMQPLEQGGNKQASWRFDPARAGLGGALADIGTHAYHLVEFVSGRDVLAICADLSTFVSGRRLDDDANVLLRLEGGAKGTLVCSQVACGQENDLCLRIYGTRASLEWQHRDSNSLYLKPAREPVRILRAGKDFDIPAAHSATRLPAGHPEGYIEAFATIYRAFAADVRRRGRGERPTRDYPSVREGLRGLEFIAAAVESAARGNVWIELSQA